MQGAQPEELERLIKEHQGPANDSGETLLGQYIDLTEFVDIKQIDCLNQNDEHPAKNAFEKGGSLLKSDVDEQLMINMQFNQAVKLHSLKIVAPEGRAPHSVKIYVNRHQTLGFDESDLVAETELLEFDKNDYNKGIAIKALRFVKYQSVHSVQLFFINNVSDDDVTVFMSSFPPRDTHSHFGRRGINRSTALALPARFSRSTKKIEKLVLFPSYEPNIPVALLEDDNEQLHLPDEASTEAERTDKTERLNLPRATAYCAAQRYDLNRIENYLNIRNVVPKKYDDCLYASHEQNDLNWISSDDTFNLKLFAKVLTDNQIENNNNSQSESNKFIESITRSDLRKWMNRREVFIFEYGVIVIWNASKEDELVYLEYMREFAVGEFSDNEMDIEEVCFQYDLDGPPQPRIFNDLITLTSGNPLIKLTLSHGLAQSVKMGSFEDLMEETIKKTIPLPRNMASKGDVNMPRKDIMKTVGSLFRLRMNINLVSDILDTPEIFWNESEMNSLYAAIREYLEIDQRVDMLSDHVNSNQMNVITWIIIVLILVAVVYYDTPAMG
ncbi:hypothetical protein HK096_003548 [Nowakowskiella sp. JEL0078]|nr:hypothetical protein HK096_003548 [Nowakowskiella sp. JEL0078]